MKLFVIPGIRRGTNERHVTTSADCTDWQRLSQFIEYAAAQAVQEHFEAVRIECFWS